MFYKIKNLTETNIFCNLSLLKSKYLLINSLEY